MIEAGILTADDPVELLEGILVFKIPKDEPHNVAAGLLDDELRAVLPEGWCSRNQGSLTLPDGEPEPDAAIVKGDRRKYLRENRKPGAADTAVVIEISNATLQRDRTIKLRSYARAGIPTYWIVNLPQRVVEVYSQLQSDDPTDPHYAHSKVYHAGQNVPLLIDGQQVGVIRVDQIPP